MTVTNLDKPKYLGSSLDGAYDYYQFRNAYLVFSMFLLYTIQDSRILPKWIFGIMIREFFLFGFK